MYLYQVAYVYIAALLLILLFAPMLISIAMLGWFGYAVGCAIGETGTEKDSEENGGFLGMLIGIAAGIYMVFFAG